MLVFLEVLGDRLLSQAPWALVFAAVATLAALAIGLPAPQLDVVLAVLILPLLLASVVTVLLQTFFNVLLRWLQREEDDPEVGPPRT